MAEPERTPSPYAASGLLRTSDVAFGEDYWATLDNGAGYVDSIMWEDLSVIVREVFGYSRVSKPWRDATSRLNHIDVGCAMGFLVRHLRRRGIQSWGCDISEYALDHAPSDTRSYLRRYDLTAPVIDENAVQHLPGWPYNLVTCFETMEHIPEEYVSMALTRIMKMVDGRDGWIIFTICTSSQPGWDTDPTHVTIKPREWWEEKLVETGFQLAPEMEERLRDFYLFHEHDGVFVVS